MLFNCDKKSPTGNTPLSSVTDIDGNTYQTIQLGSKWWMAENLRVTHYRNGDAIPKVTTNIIWADLSTGAYCLYGNSEINASIYGYLYNWYAVNDSRNIAIDGWHVPTDDEWKELEMALGMSPSDANNTSNRGTNEGSKLAGNAALWNDGGLEMDAAFGESGFSALPAGYRSWEDGHFDDIGRRAYFWSSTEHDINYAWIRMVSYYYAEVYRLNYSNKRYGFSVRLVRD